METSLIEKCFSQQHDLKKNVSNIMGKNISGKNKAGSCRIAVAMHLF